MNIATELDGSYELKPKDAVGQDGGDRHEKITFHRIVTGDDIWIYHNNSKSDRSYVNPSITT